MYLRGLASLALGLLLSAGRLLLGIGCALLLYALTPGCGTARHIARCLLGTSLHLVKDSHIASSRFVDRLPGGDRSSWLTYPGAER